jgi:cytoskeletal protein RodZ
MSDFGGSLRQAREARGISLRQIAATTKISVGALEALERNDVSKLPGGIFSRAFVRSYAAEVGLDPERTVREFLDRFDIEPSPEPQVHVAFSEVEQSLEQRRRMAVLAVQAVLVLVVVAGLVTYFVIKSRAAADETAPTPPIAEVSAAPLPDAPAVTATAGMTPAPSQADEMRLELHPSGSCWVKLMVDGKTVLARVMEAGERETVIVRDTAVVDIGNAGLFAFSIDGRPGKPVGTRGQVTSIRLTRATVDRYLR